MDFFTEKYQVHWCSSNDLYRYLYRLGSCLLIEFLVRKNKEFNFWIGGTHRWNSIQRQHQNDDGHHKNVVPHQINVLNFFVNKCPTSSVLCKRVETFWMTGVSCISERLCTVLSPLGSRSWIMIGEEREGSKFGLTEIIFQEWVESHSHECWDHAQQNVSTCWWSASSVVFVL
jgi:hypothetical protein